jgi:hypothetical protein
MSATKPLRFPVVVAASEYLVMGYLMRRNINVYKAPINNEGYDLISIHPDPRHKPKTRTKPQVRIQVKSRYATDAPRMFPLKAKSLDAFDFLVLVFTNIGTYNRRRGKGYEPTSPLFFTFPQSVIPAAHETGTSWEKVRLSNIRDVDRYEGDRGFELIAKALGVVPPTRPPEVGD